MSSQRLGLPFHRAVSVQALDSHKYEIDLFKARDWSYGPNVHGGFLASVILRTISIHFSTTLAKYQQPHTLTLHVNYLRPATAGKAFLEVRDVKVGAGTSTVHVSLIQDGKERVVGYATNMKMQVGKGVSYPTDFKLDPAPPPVSLSALAKNQQDTNWISNQMPYEPNSFVNAQTHFKFAMAVSGPLLPTIMDLWATPADPTVKITTEMLAFIADSWPHPAENYRPGSVHSHDGIVGRFQRFLKGTDLKTDHGWQSPFWYPTLLMNLEIKKQLPPEGVDWVFMRARAKEMKDGRADVEVLILDEDMNLLALAQHICFIVKFPSAPVRGKQGATTTKPDTAGSKL